MLGIELSRTTIGDVLKKTPLKPHQKECRCIAPKGNAAFAACMEDVLEVYHRPYDERRPVCLCIPAKDEEGLGEGSKVPGDRTIFSGGEGGIGDG
jgi:hypothetical protein